MRWLAELAVSFGFGIVAAILPTLNNEAYILASQLTGLAAAWPVIVGLGLGNGLGKMIVFRLVRAGSRLPWWTLASRNTPKLGVDAPAEPSVIRRPWWHQRWNAIQCLTRRLLPHIESPRWGAPIVALAAATSIPPIYPVTLLAGATRMPSWVFAIAVTLGSLVRAALLVAIALGLVHLL